MSWGWPWSRAPGSDEDQVAMITLAAEIRAISLGEAESLTDTHRYPVPQVRPHRSRTAQIPRLTVQLLAPVLATWDVRGIHGRRRLIPQVLPQATDHRRT